MPARKRLVISRPAKADLLDIWDYIAADNLAAADNLLRRIHDAIDRLPEFPEGSRYDPRFDAYLLVLSPYIVAYSVTDDEIEVMRIVDGRRNLDAIFP